MFPYEFLLYFGFTFLNTYIIMDFKKKVQKNLMLSQRKMRRIRCRGAERPPRRLYDQPMAGRLQAPMLLYGRSLPNVKEVF